MFNLIIRVNEKENKKRTKDVKKAIMDCKPEFVYTDSYITLSKGAGKNKVTTERKLNLTQSKRLFGDENVLEVFVNNLTMEFT